MITKLELGLQPIGGHQGVIIVREIYDGEATIYIYSGDAHRVERMSIDDALIMLNMLEDIDYNDPEYETVQQEVDTYWSTEHPERRLVACWPDDYEYDDEWAKLNAGVEEDGFAIDVETGEVYDEILV